MGEGEEAESSRWREHVMSYKSDSNATASEVMLAVKSMGKRLLAMDCDA